MKKHRKKKSIIGRTNKRLNPILDKVFGVWITVDLKPEIEYLVTKNAAEQNITVEEYILKQLRSHINELRAQL